jgi:hypothetical protein
LVKALTVRNSVANRHQNGENGVINQLESGNSKPGSKDVIHEIQAELAFPDEPEVGRVKAVVKITERRLIVSMADPAGHRFFDRTYVPFRGPRFLQCLLTPLASVIGMLFSKRDLGWIGMDTDSPALRITPIVPPDFWLEIFFQAQQDATEAASLLDRFWR